MTASMGKSTEVAGPCNYKTTMADTCCAEGHRLPWVREEAPGLLRFDISVPDIHCAGCIAKIESALGRELGVAEARVNLSTKRITVQFKETETGTDALLALVESLGFAAHPYRPEHIASSRDDQERQRLLWALAVSGFAAANIMLLSVSVWSGATGATRDLFHWVSALIALPAVVYAGGPFYRSAWASLRHWRLNMDVPISLAVILAAGASLFETVMGGAETYFDASVMLLFFLLIGRTLDHVMRARARSAVTELVSMSPLEAVVVGPDGARKKIAVSEIDPGTTVAIAAGERIPMDGKVVKGISDLDCSLVTGESQPETVSEESDVYAGMMNLSAPLEVEVTATREDTFLAEIVRLMEAAEQGKARYVRIASRIAEIYAPFVHVLAALTFLGWLWVTAGDWHQSLMAAITVLIITCPCALGLAVPVVQIVASGKLFRKGIMVKDGAGLEKLALTDTILFDKTGTLTLGRPELTAKEPVDERSLAIAMGLARESRHPLSRAIVMAAEVRGVGPADVDQIIEHAGLGMEGRWQGKRVRLGGRSWCGFTGELQDNALDGTHELCLSVEDGPEAQFYFDDSVRPGAKEVIDQAIRSGFNVAILSGDRKEAAYALAKELGIREVHAPLKPQEKTAYIKELAKAGRSVLMVGDGINDAPALSAALTSMAPSSASDVGRMAADFVFLGDRLNAVTTAIGVARRAQWLIRQNFALALLYNLIAIPIAVMGHASPLIAAIAMSSSSLIVTLNALRLRLEPSSSRFEQPSLQGFSIAQKPV